jgi:hypothetical protein
MFVILEVEAIIATLLLKVKIQKAKVKFESLKANTFYFLL